MFVPGKPFQPSLMFAGKARAYPSEAASGAPLYGRPLALPTNIRLGGRGLPGTNTVNYSREKYYTIGPSGLIFTKVLTIILRSFLMYGCLK